MLRFFLTVLIWMAFGAWRQPLVLAAPANVPPVTGTAVTPFLADGRWGFRRADGSVVVKPVYFAVKAAGHNRYYVQFSQDHDSYSERGPIDPKNPVGSSLGLWGVVDATGLVAVPPVFNYISAFTNGRAVVGVRAYLSYETGSPTLFSTGTLAGREGDLQARFGIVTDTGVVVAKPIYDQIEYFSEGLAKAQLNGYALFLGKDGQVKIQTKYCDAGSFHEGLAWVKDCQAGDKVGSVHRGKFGVIDTSGKLAAPMDFDLISIGFCAGKAAAFKGVVPVETDAAPVTGSGIWYLIDRQGHLLEKLPNEAAAVAAGDKCQSK